MGMFRDTAELDADLVKEMAEGLGSQGIRLEEILDRIRPVRHRVDLLQQQARESTDGAKERYMASIAAAIKEHNALVDKAAHALHWLLIQREACGFRTHRNVSRYYPIPEKIKPFTR